MLYVTFLFLLISLTVTAQDESGELPTPTPSETPTEIVIPTLIPSPTDIPLPTSTSTDLPTSTTPPTETPVPTNTQTELPTATVDVTLTATGTVEASVMPSFTATVPEIEEGVVFSQDTGCTIDVPPADATALIEAINIANGNGVADTICLTADSTYAFTASNNANSEGANALPVVTSPIIFEGNNAVITRNATGYFRFLEIGGSGIVTINELNFTNGKAGSGSQSHSNASGGAIYSYGNLTIMNSTFFNNSSPNNGGGAIIARGTDGQLSIINSIFTTNMANGAGGALV